MHDVGISTSSTPGRQTVPRAEVWAAIMAAHAAAHGQRGHECVCSIVVVDVAAAGSVAVTLAR